MGTFTVSRFKFIGLLSPSDRAGSFFTQGWWGNGASDDAGLLSGLLDFSGDNIHTAHYTQFTTGGGLATFFNEISFSFSHSDLIFSLDGNPSISYDELPDGFTILTGILSVLIEGNNFSIGDFMSAQFGILPSQIDSNLGDSVFNPIFNISGMKISDFIDNILNLQSRTSNLPVGAGSTSHQFFGLSISGTYDIEQFQFTFNLQPSQPVKPGDPVVITSDPKDPKHLNLKNLTLTITPEDPDDDPIPVKKILVQTESYLEFLLPDFSLKKPKILEIELIGNGVQFSGSVSAGILDTIYFNAASGIYVLTPGKTTDTLYDRNLVFPITTPKINLNLLFEEDNEYQTRYLLKSNIIIDDIYGELEIESVEDEDEFIISESVDRIGTSDFNIPNPFIKTGFIP